MGTDYYSYIVVGVNASEYIFPIEYEEKTPSYVEIEGKKESIYFGNGKPIFKMPYKNLISDVKIKVGWKFNNKIYKNRNELEIGLSSLGLSLITYSCEDEIRQEVSIGLFVSKCERSVIVDFDTIIDKLKDVRDILNSIGIDEPPKIINILHVSY